MYKRDCMMQKTDTVSFFGYVMLFHSKLGSAFII